MGVGSPFSIPNSFITDLAYLIFFAMVTAAMSAYFYRYVEYLRLPAYLKNIDTDLDASSKLDNFVDGTLFPLQYRLLIREDWKS